MDILHFLPRWFGKGLGTSFATLGVVLGGKYTRKGGKKPFHSWNRKRVRKQTLGELFLCVVLWLCLSNSVVFREGKAAVFELKLNIAHLILGPGSSASFVYLNR